MPSTADYTRAVARAAGLDRELLIGRNRTTRPVRLRQAMMLVLKVKTRPGLSLTQIGMRLGNRDHTTVMHGVRKILLLLVRREPEALRCYRIAIRAWVKLVQAERELARRHAAVIEGDDYAFPCRVQRPELDPAYDQLDWVTRGVREAQPGAA